LIAIASALFIACVIGLFFKVTRWLCLTLVALLLLLLIL
jgi:hypothetical protein